MAMTPQGWSISAMAVELGRDRRTIAAAVADILPISTAASGNLYRLSEVLAAMGGTRPTNEDARNRKLVAEAELAEIEIGKARGELIEITQVARMVSDEYSAVRAKLLSLPDKLAPLVAMETTEAPCRAAIARGITEALDELIGAVAPGDADGVDESPPRVAEATADADGERVGGHLSQAFV